MGSLAVSSMDSGFWLQKTGKLTAVLALLIMAFIIIEPVMARSYMYKAVREISKVQMLWQTRNWKEIDGSHFIVRYQPGDSNIAKLVLDVAEKSFAPVSGNFGYTPLNKTLLVIYPTKESLGRSFGWEADESAMGVYWAGVIRILSPNAWVEETDPTKVTRIFESEGPVAHELTHLMVDYKTGGNYTRWFTEGIAQYEEGKLTGYQMEHPNITVPEDMYSLSMMDTDFDSLADQNLAYFESLQAVRYLVHQYGEKNLKDILTDLGRGRTMGESFRGVLGITMEQFENNFKIWTVANQ